MHSSSVVDLDVFEGHGVVLAVPGIPPLFIVPRRRKTNQRLLVPAGGGMDCTDHDKDDDERNPSTKPGPRIFGDGGDITAATERGISWRISGESLDNFTSPFCTAVADTEFNVPESLIVVPRRHVGLKAPARMPIKSVLQYKQHFAFLGIDEIESAKDNANRRSVPRPSVTPSCFPDTFIRSNYRANAASSFVFRAHRLHNLGV